MDLKKFLHFMQTNRYWSLRHLRSSDAIAYKDKDVVTMLDMTIKGS